jgi:hypothetical protein
MIPPCTAWVREIPYGGSQLVLMPSRIREAIGGPVMDAPARSTPHVARFRETSQMHNASVDEMAAMAGECAQVHLPSGRVCTLQHGHSRSCEFIRR